MRSGSSWSGAIIPPGAAANTSPSASPTTNVTAERHPLRLHSEASLSGSGREVGTGMEGRGRWEEGAKPFRGLVGPIRVYARPLADAEVSCLPRAHPAPAPQFFCRHRHRSCLRSAARQQRNKLFYWTDLDAHHCLLLQNADTLKTGRMQVRLLMRTAQAPDAAAFLAHPRAAPLAGATAPTRLHRARPRRLGTAAVAGWGGLRCALRCIVRLEGAASLLAAAGARPAAPQLLSPRRRAVLGGGTDGAILAVAALRLLASAACSASAASPQLPPPVGHDSESGGAVRLVGAVAHVAAALPAGLVTPAAVEALAVLADSLGAPLFGRPETSIVRSSCIGFASSGSSRFIFQDAEAGVGQVAASRAFVDLPAAAAGWWFLRGPTWRGRPAAAAAAAAVLRRAARRSPDRLAATHAGGGGAAGILDLLAELCPPPANVVAGGSDGSNSCDVPAAPDAKAEDLCEAARVALSDALELLLLASGVAAAAAVAAIAAAAAGAAKRGVRRFSVELILRCAAASATASGGAGGSGGALCDRMLVRALVAVVCCGGDVGSSGGQDWEGDGEGVDAVLCLAALIEVRLLSSLR